MTDLEKHRTGYAMGYVNGIDRAIEVISDHCELPDYWGIAMKELETLKALVAEPASQAARDEKPS